MTPQQKIKHMILIRHCEFVQEIKVDVEGITPLNIDAIYDKVCEAEDGAVRDTENEFREGEVETGLKCDWSRHYESKAVAAQYGDGSWVGWTYWYGGGKHSEPDAIEWVSDAYDLACTEEEKMVTVRTFTKPEDTK